MANNKKQQTYSLRADSTEQYINYNMVQIWQKASNVTDYQIFFM